MTQTCLGYFWTHLFVCIYVLCFHTVHLSVLEDYLIYCITSLLCVMRVSCQTVKHQAFFSFDLRKRKMPDFHDTTHWFISSVHPVMLIWLFNNVHCILIPNSHLCNSHEAPSHINTKIQYTSIIVWINESLNWHVNAEKVKTCTEQHNTITTGEHS